LSLFAVEFGYLAWGGAGIGRNMLFMFLVGCLCFLIIFIMESKLTQRNWFGGSKSLVKKSNERDEALALLDADVAAEGARIRDTNLTQLFKTDNLILRDLTKMYGKFKAVDELCLGVQKGECFGM
jgi:hypothetical protein